MPAPTPDPAALRRTRGVTAGLVCGGGAVLAHVAAGGAAPAATTAIGLVLAVVLVSGALAHRRLALPTLLGLTLVGQGLLHLALATDPHAAHTGAVPGAITAPVGGPLHEQPVLMLTAHLLAALATAVIAGSGERAWWRLLSALAGPVRLLRLPRSPVPPPAVGLPPVVPARPWRVGRDGPRVRGSRGPPTAYAAAPVLLPG